MFKTKGIYRGVVEDNQDPLFKARVKIRIFGIHTPELGDLSTEDLPWAEQACDLFSIAESGFGMNSVPKQGTHLWIFFEAEDHTKPVYFAASKTQMDNKPTANFGFRDPDEVYPDKLKLGEPDLGRLATVTNLSKTIDKTIIDAKDEVSGVSGGDSGADVSMSEPDSLASSSKYTFNNVIETPSGNVIELDDTESNERIRIIHKSGSYMEMRPDGSFITKSQSGEQNYVILEGAFNEHIKMEVKRYLEHNLDEVIAGGIRRHIEMDRNEHIKGFFQLTADGHLEIINDVKISGNLEVTEKITAGDNVSSKAEVADSSGNLSSLRSAYDSHEHSNPVDSAGDSQGNTTGHPSDPKTRWGDFTWSNIPLGFK